MTLPTELSPGSLIFDAQAVSVLVDERVPVVSVTFGVLSARWIAAFQWIGTVVIGTASTSYWPTEGKALEDGGSGFRRRAGGSGAGAHRATFLAPVARSLIGTVGPRADDGPTRSPCPSSHQAASWTVAGVAAAHMLRRRPARNPAPHASCRHPRVARRRPTSAAVLMRRPEESTGVTRVYPGRAARGVLNRLARAQLEPARRRGRVTPVSVAERPHARYPHRGTRARGPPGSHVLIREAGALGLPPTLPAADVFLSPNRPRDRRISSMRWRCRTPSKGVRKPGSRRYP